MRQAKRFVAWIVAAVVLAGCESEAERQKDALAKAMSIPVSKLCPIPQSADNQEGGGLCQGDCQKAKAVRHARYILSAATELEKLAPSPDAQTEALLVPMRAAAHAYASEVGPACPVDIKPHDTTMSEVEGCAIAAKTPPVEAREADFRKALETFLTAMPKGHGFAKPSRCAAPRR